MNSVRKPQEEYFYQQEEFTKKYGNNCILFMRIGDFFEAYSTPTRGFDLDRVHDITDLTKTRKTKAILTVSDKNPNMMGFQHNSLHKYLRMMINGGLIVAIIDQTTSGKGVPCPRHSSLRL